jgi:hypothetical protein
MGCTKRCFASVETLRHRNPQVLRDLLALFPDHVAARGLVLPRHATVENLNYEGIRDALMQGDIPEELDDILYLSSLLGNVKGWSMIEQQLADDGREMPDFSADDDYADLAILAAIHNWPQNKSILEKSIARARVHSKSAYVYYAPALDLRSKFRLPDEASLAEAREALCVHFVNEGLVGDGDRRKATEIVPYDFENEIWFLVRYPGRRARQSGYNHGNWQNFVFNPEQYDAVAYNKVYGDLRMNTKRKREHARYRMTFGHLLFDQSGGFREKAGVVTLDPLLRPDGAGLFNCDDIPGLAMIVPVALTYETLSLPPRQWTESAVDGGSLLHGNKHAPRILPREAHHVLKAVFQYRLKDSTRLSRLTIDGGNKVTFERDGDSVVVERWLRKRGFVQTFVEVAGHAFGNVVRNFDAAANA